MARTRRSPPESAPVPSISRSPSSQVLAGTVVRPYPAKTDRREPSPSKARTSKLDGRFFGVGAAR
jgi:hypothetical protein